MGYSNTSVEEYKFLLNNQQGYYNLTDSDITKGQTIRKSISPSEQKSLTEGLTGGKNATMLTPPNFVQTTTIASQKPDKITVYEKTKVGSKKKGFEYYLMDKQGNIYKVDKQTYNKTTKGKTIDITKAKKVDPNNPKIAKRIRTISENLRGNASKEPGNVKQVPKHNYNLITNQQAYHNQQQDMYTKLFNSPESHVAEAKGDIRYLNQ